MLPSNPHVADSPPSSPSSPAKPSPSGSTPPCSPNATQPARDPSPDAQAAQMPEQAPSADPDDDALEDALSSWFNAPTHLDAISVPDLPPTEQLQHIEGLAKRSLSIGDTWYLIASEWYVKWTQYCRRLASIIPGTRLLGEKAPPGPVDNSSIVSNGNLAADMNEDEHFKLIHEEAWQCLVQWYGEPAVSLPRQVVSEGESHQQLTIDVYPNVYILYLIQLTPVDFTRERCPRFSMSRTSTLANLRSTIENELDLAPGTDFQLWTLGENANTDRAPYVGIDSLAEMMDLEKTERTLSEVSLGSQALVVELKDKRTGIYPSSMQGVTSSASSTSSGAVVDGFSNLTTSSVSPRPVAAPSHPRGVCGLSNLGNTCFMNSAIQCLSNTEHLSKWFLAATYKNDLNRNNPLGMEGELAVAYGQLLEKLWSGTDSSISPRDFKYTISHWNPTFSGYQQHDSQELLGFLLDGLHEDLNRILKKPYIELPDFDNMPDDEIAQKSWEYHKARNDSIIVDHFQGQFKSKLVCNDCGKISVTFDPFMSLSLPLPIRKKSRTELVYVPYDPSQRPLSLIVWLNQNASMKHLKDEVARRMGVDNISKLMSFDVFNGSFYKVYKDDDMISDISQHEKVYVYELPVIPPSKPSDTASENNADNPFIVIPVVCASLPPADGTMSTRSLSPFGDPFILCALQRDLKTVEDVYRLIVQHLERYAIVKLCEEVPYVELPSDGISLDEIPLEEAPQQDDMSNQVETAYRAVEPEQSHIHKQESPMRIDVLEQTPVDTAAAVTAAGGKRLAPMNNLFAMKVVPSTESDSLIPTFCSWDDLKLSDLQERAMALDGLAKEETLEDEPTGDDASNMASNCATEEDRMLRDTSMTGSCDDIANTDNNTLDATLVDPSPSSLKQENPGPLISQGEGVLLEWRLPKAQQVFGVSPSNANKVDDQPWKEMKESKSSSYSAFSADDSTEKRQVTLAHCLDEFTKEEQLGEEDLWYCPRCKDHKRVTKKFDLWKLPEILVVHLKRFSHTRWRRDKIDDKIDFPLEALDMTDRVLSIKDHERLASEDRLLYDLYAVDNHFGGLGGGHYTAYAKNWHNQQWYNFDDSHVSKVEPNKVKTQAAYLLFYKRRRPTQDPDHDDEEHVEVDTVEDDAITDVNNS